MPADPPRSRWLPWLLLAGGLFLLAVALPVAIVAFLRAASPSSFGGQAFSLITGQQQESSNLPMLLIVLAGSAAVAFLGAALSLTSLFVLTKRGARKAAAGTRVAVEAVGQHHLTRQAKQALSDSRQSLPERGRGLKESIKARQVTKDPKQLKPPEDS